MHCDYSEPVPPDCTYPVFHPDGTRKAELLPGKGICVRTETCEEQCEMMGGYWIPNSLGLGYEDMVEMCQVHGVCQSITPDTLRATSAPDISAPDGNPIVISNGKPSVDIDIPDPGVHTCCDEDCLRCLLDAMRKTESSDRCDTNNTCDGPGCVDDDGNRQCAACGCVPPWTQAKKEICWSCGPYQIQKRYWDDARQQCHSERAPECCELNDIGWNSLCDGTLSCAEQKRLSELAIMCWWRRFTRNGNCQCTGNCNEPGCGPNTDCPDRCFTCEDLARIHNGGACGHNSSGTEGYINDRNKVCHWLCEAGGSCPACLGCDCGGVTPSQKEERRSMSSPPRTGGKNKIKKNLKATNKRTRKTKNQKFWEGFGGMG